MLRRAQWESSAMRSSADERAPAKKKNKGHARHRASVSQHRQPAPTWTDQVVYLHRPEGETPIWAKRTSLVVNDDGGRPTDVGAEVTLTDEIDMPRVTLVGRSKQLEIDRLQGLR